jgi:hypothetical protein
MEFQESILLIPESDLKEVWFFHHFNLLSVATEESWKG